MILLYYNKDINININLWIITIIYQIHIKYVKTTNLLKVLYLVKSCIIIMKIFIQDNFFVNSYTIHIMGTYIKF